MIKRHALAVAAFCFATFLSTPGNAATLYQFDLIGSATASWQMEAEPTPSGTRSDFGYDAFYVTGAPVVFNGISDVAELEFASELDWYGGFGINVGGGAYEVSAIGAYLFDGPSSNPAFKTGTFNLVGYFNSNLSYTLSISEVSTSPVPEPATWAMMIAGFGMVGGALRRRDTSTTFITA